jgi:hypothetical protein
MEGLMTRDQFRNAVFERDDHKCVICEDKAKDAHHIMDRRLFSDGGYYLDNGASLCESHHIDAEKTTLSCSKIREAAGIKIIILPPHLYSECEYDKWGNEILKNGVRIKGELFDDVSVQTILKDVMYMFLEDKVKYPRTYHLPWSPGMMKDDRMMDDVHIFEGKRVIITEKLDGENTTWYNFGMHARSLDSGSHPSRGRVKDLWAQKSYNIPDNWRICGENMVEKHSIHYSKKNENALTSYFYMFSIWDERNVCLSWDETKEWATLFEIELVPVLYEGIWDMKVIEQLNQKMELTKHLFEGYVVRLADEFHYSQFRKSVGKYVRKNHVANNHGHWTQRKKIILNELI